jgi:phosphoenolpyruvate-protein phosphotransferase/dihydroxyacetone kinase phosphotransfer subunit
MIGIVVVSHSKKLAEATLELARQMTPAEIPIAIAGGIDDPANPIGTDPMAIVAAIDEVYSDDGVVVLMDLGSALLSADMALEFLPPEQHAHIHLCEAPLVEGTLAAAVQAGIGSPIEQVLVEARRALEAKQIHLASETARPDDLVHASPAITDSTQELRVHVPNRLGLHARPAARIVSLAGQYDATLIIDKGPQRVDARSINQVATLGARQGDEIVFYADGPAASELITALRVLVDDNFGDHDERVEKPVAKPQTTSPPDGHEGIATGIPAAPGIAIAPAYRLDAQAIIPERYDVNDTAAELQRLRTAIDEAVQELDQVAAQTRQKLGTAEADIFEVHSLILQDPELVDTVQKQIRQTAHNAEYVWWETIEQTANRYATLDDDYLRVRAADVIDVGRRVLRKLSPHTTPVISITTPGILVAQDLSPSDTAQLDPEKVVGILAAKGGATSHSAILARALGIPAVVGLESTYQQIEPGATIAMDGRTGWVWLEPSAEQLKQLHEKQQSWLETQRRFRAQCHEPAVTLDGHRIDIAANVGRVEDVLLATEVGAEGVGLFRTELLFMDRPAAPSEQEQYEAYVQAAQPIGDSPLIVRTLDVGGDKPLAYIDIGDEGNPFLGYRGVRYWLDTPAVARPQLRAICRASAEHHLKIMFPMISTLAELLRAKMLVRSVQDELQAENVRYDPNVEIGIMIEVPSAVLIADQLAQHVDFFSIGTNDLTQYVLAADRGNLNVSELANPLQPAVLRAINQIIATAHRAGIRVSVCGEMASRPLAVPVLVGLGADELSMSSPAIPEVKALIRSLTYRETQRLATEVLDLDSAAVVEAHLEESARTRTKSAT